jgi:hypothetical protein
MTGGDRRNLPKDSLAEEPGLPAGLSHTTTTTLGPRAPWTQRQP